VGESSDTATYVVMSRNGEALMNGQFYSIASDFQRGAMIQVAMQRAGEIARESFYHGLLVGDLGEAELALFAEDAWERFSKTVTFDYPGYAHDLFHRAYRMSYQAYADDLPQGIRPNTYVLAELLEEEVRQAHDHH
jgi:hypothetical protein